MEKNGSCSAAFYESAALRAGACSPERADFPRPGEDVTAGDKRRNLDAKRPERVSVLANANLSERGPSILLTQDRSVA